jgi:hypothetical protein
MSSSAALTRRVNRMIDMLQPRIMPKNWIVLLEPGEPLPDALQRQLGIYDQVLIREIPRGFVPGLTPAYYSYEMSR